MQETWVIPVVCYLVIDLVKWILLDLRDSYELLVTRLSMIILNGISTISIILYTVISARRFRQQCTRQQQLQQLQQLQQQHYKYFHPQNLQLQQQQQQQQQQLQQQQQQQQQLEQDTEQQSSKQHQHNHNSMQQKSQIEQQQQQSEQQQQQLSLPHQTLQTTVPHLPPQQQQPQQAIPTQLQLLIAKQASSFSMLRAFYFVQHLVSAMGSVCMILFSHSLPNEQNNNNNNTTHIAFIEILEAIVIFECFKASLTLQLEKHLALTKAATTTTATATSSSSPRLNASNPYEDDQIKNNQNSKINLAASTITTPQNSNKNSNCIGVVPPACNNNNNNSSSYTSIAGSKSQVSPNNSNGKNLSKHLVGHALLRNAFVIFIVGVNLDYSDESESTCIAGLLVSILCALTSLSELIKYYMPCFPFNLFFSSACSSPPPSRISVTSPLLTFFARKHSQKQQQQQLQPQPHQLSSPTLQMHNSPSMTQSQMNQMQQLSPMLRSQKMKQLQQQSIQQQMQLLDQSSMGVTAGFRSDCSLSPVASSGAGILEPSIISGHGGRSAFSIVMRQQKQQSMQMEQSQLLPFSKQSSQLTLAGNQQFQFQPSLEQQHQQQQQTTNVIPILASSHLVVNGIGGGGSFLGQLDSQNENSEFEKRMSSLNRTPQDTTLLLKSQRRRQSSSSQLLLSKRSVFSSFMGHEADQDGGGNSYSNNNAGIMYHTTAASAGGNGNLMSGGGIYSGGGSHIDHLVRGGSGSAGGSYGFSGISSGVSGMSVAGIMRSGRGFSGTNANAATTAATTNSNQINNNNNIGSSQSSEIYERDSSIQSMNYISASKEAKKQMLKLRRKHFLISNLLSRKKRVTMHTMETGSFSLLHQNPHRTIDETPVYQIIENISLGLLCYDVETKEIVFTNGQILDIFNEDTEEDVFRVMLMQRNYVVQHDQPLVNNNNGGGGSGAAFANNNNSFCSGGGFSGGNGLGGGVPQISRNLDMLPLELFSQDFRQASSSNCLNTQRSIPDNQQQQQQSNQYCNNNSTYPSFGIQQTMTQLNAMEAKNFESDSTMRRRVIYSQASTLKQQLKELVFAIQSEQIGSETLAESKIRFMASVPRNMNPKVGRSNSSGNFTPASSTAAAAAGAGANNMKERILQITLTPLLSAEKLLVLFIVEDVTHFNQIKVLESLNKNKSSMLSQVSHEIRNPVSCIIAMLEEIQESPGVSEKKNVIDCCQSALQSSKLLLNLLNDLLDMSQIKAGKFKLILDSFNLVELLEEVRHMMQPLARHKDNTICVQFDDTYLDRKAFLIKSDKYRLRQILINLISNSIKYTHKGNIFLSVAPERVDERYLRISVRDEGIGIKKEFRQNLFQAFGVAEDIENKAKNNPHGVGLGLLISNTIAKNLKPAAGQIAAATTNPSNGGAFFPGKQSQLMARTPPPHQNVLKERQTFTFASNPFAMNNNNNSNSNGNGTPVHQLAGISNEEGLHLNEEIEIGSEFYFSIFNYMYLQQPGAGASFNQQDSPLPNNVLTPRSRNVSIFANMALNNNNNNNASNANISQYNNKRPSVFLQEDAVLSLNAIASPYVFSSPHDFSMPSSSNIAAAMMHHPMQMWKQQQQQQLQFQQQHHTLDELESEESHSTNGNRNDNNRRRYNSNFYEPKKQQNSQEVSEDEVNVNVDDDDDDDLDVDDDDNNSQINGYLEIDNTPHNNNNNNNNNNNYQKKKKILNKNFISGSTTPRGIVSSPSSLSGSMLVESLESNKKNKFGLTLFVSQDRSLTEKTSPTSSPLSSRSKSAYKKGVQNMLSSVIAEHVAKKDHARRFIDTEVNVMIVDDDQFSALALKSKITAAFNVFSKNVAVSISVFYSGADGVRELQKAEKVYSYMFIDCQMPGMDGFETVAFLDSLGLRKYSAQMHPLHSNKVAVSTTTTSANPTMKRFFTQPGTAPSEEHLQFIHQQQQQYFSQYHQQNIYEQEISLNGGRQRTNTVVNAAKPLFQELQIVLCSGMPKEDHLLYEAAIPFFLLKPIDQQSLLAIIKQTFDESNNQIITSAQLITPPTDRRGTLYHYTIQRI